MGRTRTLSLLRDDVRFAADVEGETDRHPDASLTRLINQSIAEYRRQLPQHYLTTATGSVTAGTSTVAPPADIDHVYRFSIESASGIEHVIHEWQSAERYDYEAYTTDRGLPSYWRHEGSSLVLIPVPDAAYSYTLVYVPQHTDLAADDDVFDPVISGGEEWVVYDVATKLAMRDDVQRVQMLQQERARLMRELMRRAERNAGPGRRVDTRGQRARASMRAHWWWR